MSGEFGPIALMLGALCLWVAPVSATDHLSAEQVRAIVAAVPKGTADLAGKDMSGDDLTGLDLSGTSLAGADLTRANLHGVKLVGVDLSRRQSDRGGHDLRLDHARQLQPRPLARRHHANDGHLNRDG